MEDLDDVNKLHGFAGHLVKEVSVFFHGKLSAKALILLWNRLFFYINQTLSHLVLMVQ